MLERWGRGNPFVNQGAGRIKTSEQNERRMQQILTNFQQSSEGSSILKSKQHQMVVTKAQANSGWFIFPLAGTLFGLAGSYSFVHPNSKYIGKCFIILTTYIGYLQAARHQQDYEYSRRVGMYPYFPKDIQTMLNNNDFRYGRKWLNINDSSAQNK